MLHAAAAANDATTATHLLNAGARPNQIDAVLHTFRAQKSPPPTTHSALTLQETGGSPLHVAAAQDSSAVAEVLIAHGADVNMADNVRPTTSLTSGRVHAHLRLRGQEQRRGRRQPRARRSRREHLQHGVC